MAGLDKLGGGRLRRNSRVFSVGGAEKVVGTLFSVEPAGRRSAPAGARVFRLDDLTTFGLFDAEHVEDYFTILPITYRRIPARKRTCWGQQTAFSGSE